MTNERSTLDATTKALIAGVCGGVFAVSLAFLAPEMMTGTPSAADTAPAAFDTSRLAADEIVPGAAPAPAVVDPVADLADVTGAADVAEVAAPVVRVPAPAPAPVTPETIPEETVEFVDEAPVAAATPPFPRRTGVGASPEPEPAAAPPATVLVTLAAGTPVEVELLDSVSSQTSIVGDAVSAVIARDVTRDELVVLPAGARLDGSVVEVVRQKKIGGQSVLVVGFDALELTSGESVPVSATLALAGEKQTEKDAAIMAGSTAGGALLGRVLKKSDRKKGTLIGAVLGAAVGTAVAAKNEADPIELPAGSVASLVLDAPVDVAVDRVKARELAELR